MADDPGGETMEAAMMTLEITTAYYCRRGYNLEDFGPGHLATVLWL